MMQDPDAPPPRHLRMPTVEALAPYPALYRCKCGFVEDNAEAVDVHIRAREQAAVERQGATDLVARALAIACDADERDAENFTAGELEELIYCMTIAAVKLKKLPGGGAAALRVYERAETELQRRGKRLRHDREVLDECAEMYRRILTMLPGVRASDAYAVFDRVAYLIKQTGRDVGGAPEPRRGLISKWTLEGGGEVDVRLFGIPTGRPLYACPVSGMVVRTPSCATHDDALCVQIGYDPEGQP